jgi:hypothetical protein
MKAIARLTLVTATGAMTLAVGTIARAQTVVQIDIDSLLDARPVSTLTNGVVVPWTQGQGIDGNGGGNGFATEGVAAKLGYKGPTLPSNGIFPAAKGLPEFDLHFSDSNAATSFQAHNVHANVVGSIQFAVPQATYSTIYLVLTDSEQADTLTVTMTYADSTTSMVGPFTMPDYDQGLPANTKDVSYFSLFSGQKWSQTDQPNDNMGHSITGVTLAPTPTKSLTSIEIAKPSDGHYLVFWGAVGIATSPVDAGAGSSGAASGSSSGATTGAASGTSSSGASGAVGGTGSSEATGSSSGTAPGSGTTVSSGTGGTVGGTGSSGTGSGAGGSSGTVASAGSTTSGTPPPASGASSTGTGTSGSSAATTSGGSSSKGCSLSAAPGSDVSLWGSLLALSAVAYRRRRA